ncbi:TNF receptor-associated factor 5-like [Ornithodoros turicata]|uniref:TNF receptor-associated factor 5-like n=1 Tax=Ornithodoros turicata TaxID=34597 RepID=UPI003139270E
MRLPVECPYKCQAILVKSTLLSHMAAECQLRLATCQFCCEAVFHVELNHHEETCSEAPISCPYCMEENVKRGDMPWHAKSCPDTPKHCPLEEYGCNFVGLDSVMDEHLSVRNHVSCFVTLKKGLEERDADIASLCNHLSSCRSDLDTLKNKMLEEVDAKISSFCDQVSSCRSDLDTLQNERKDEVLDGAQLFDDEVKWVFLTPEGDAECTHTSPLYRQRSTKTSFCFSVLSSSDNVTLRQHLLEAGTSGRSFAVTVVDGTKEVVAEKKGLVCADQDVLEWEASEDTVYVVTCALDKGQT